MAVSRRENNLLYKFYVIFFFPPIVCSMRKEKKINFLYPALKTENNILIVMCLYLPSPLLFFCDLSV